MSDKPKFDADELLALSLMEDCPVIIVEGNDDILIYENILDSIQKEGDIFASENLPKISNRIYSILHERDWLSESDFISQHGRKHFHEYSYQYKKLNKTITGKEGCVGVINAIKEIEYVAKGREYKKHIIGIIDRDARVYRSEVPDLEGIFMLKYYSIESHFINESVIAPVIDFITLKSAKTIDSSLTNSIYSNIKTNILHQYYLALDCLQNACDINYTSDFTYLPDNINSHLQHNNYQTMITNVMSRKQELDSFALSLSITNSFSDMLLILKGKWILDLFIDGLQSEIKNLSNKCKLSQIQQCQYCVHETYNKCLYKVKFFHKDSIKNLIMQQLYSINEFDYIKVELDKLAC